MTDASLAPALGAVMIAIALWATGAVPPHFTAILFMFLAVVAAIAPPKVVFSGFHSSAVWLVFGGLVLGLAVRRSGLGARGVRAMLTHFPLSYRGLIWAILLAGALLGFFIPSAMGRVMLLMPIALAFADRLGFEQGSNGHTGIALAAGIGTMMPSFAILPANVPNMALIGAAESIYGMRFSYGDYLVLNYPVMGVLSIVLLGLLIGKVFPDHPTPTEQTETIEPWSGAERRLLGILLIALALWSTDFLHGISPAWVAMGAALLAMLPRVGMVPAGAIGKDIDFGPWIFVAGVIGMGAVVTHSGLGAAFARTLFDLVPLAPDQGFATFATLYGIGEVLALVTTLPAAPAIMTPLAQGIAQATGWPLEAVLYTQVPTWIVFVFPYLAPPFVMTLALGQISVGRALKLTVPYFLIGVAVVLPLQYLWGRFLGFYP